MEFTINNEIFKNHNFELVEFENHPNSNYQTKRFKSGVSLSFVEDEGFAIASKYDRMVYVSVNSIQDFESLISMLDSTPLKNKYRTIKDRITDAFNNFKYKVLGIVSDDLPF